MRVGYTERMNERLTLNKCQLCIDYETNKYILKTFLKKVRRMLIMPVAIESLLYFTPSQVTGKFLYPLKLKILNCTLPFFPVP